MTRQEIFDILKQYFITQFEVPAGKITPEALLYQDLGLDSIDALDMIGMLEGKLDLQIDENEIKQIRSVGDIVNFIIGKIPTGSPS